MSLKFVLFDGNNKKTNKDAQKHLDARLHPIIRLNLIGESGSGKTEFMKNLLFNYYYKYWAKSGAEIHFYAGTQDTAREIAELAYHANYKPENFNVHTKFNLDNVEDIYQEHNGEKPLVFFFDDIAYKNGFNSAHKKNFITELYASGRHKNTSIIVSTQKYMFLSEDCRSLNASHLVLYSVSPKEVEKFYDENMDLIMTKPEFNKILRKYVKPKYGFIILDKLNKKVYDKDWNDITPTED